MGTIDLRFGDCLDLLPALPDASVDLILCDLPYGTTQNKWDSVIPLTALWKEYQRVSKPSAAVVLTAQAPFTFTLGMSNLSWFRYEWVWEKEAGTGFLNAKKAPLKSHESILVFSGKPPRYFPQMESGKPYTQRRGRRSANYGKDSIDEIITTNTGERYPKTVLRFPRDKHKIHPTQKPVDLFKYLIRTYSGVGEVVLDNCMGSGTAGVAAKELGRSFIGMESDERYFNAASERITVAELPQ